MEFKEELKQVFEGYNIELTDDQCSAFEKYFNLITEWNEKFNLTTILTQHDVIIKHFLDSCLVIDYLKPNSSLIDIGAGAGFPAIPIKIVRPDINVTMVDGSNKRVTFLNECIQQLGLENISAIHERCEILANKVDYREKFDYCVARAVAETNTLSEYCIPFVKLYGFMIAYKGRNYEEELAKAQSAIEMLGGKLTDIRNILIEEINAERNLLFIQKKFKTPQKFPRGQNKPRTSPL